MLAQVLKMAERLKWTSTINQPLMRGEECTGSKEMRQNITNCRHLEVSAAHLTRGNCLPLLFHRGIVSVKALKGFKTVKRVHSKRSTSEIITINKTLDGN